MTNDKNTEKQIGKVLSKQMKKIKKTFVLYKNNPYLPENTHQFRVNMRTMRALLNFIKPLIGVEEYDQLNGSFKNIANRVGPIREIDVLFEECNQIAKEQPDLVTNYADIFRFLEKQRLQLIKSESTKKAFQYFEDTLKETEEALDQLEFNLDNNDADDLEEFIVQRFKDKSSKLKKSYDEIDDTDYENIHDIRKQAKKVRYATKGFKAWLPNKEWEKTVKKTEEIQEKLGIKTDEHVNIELFEELKNKTNNDELSEAFNQLINYHKTE